MLNNVNPERVSRVAMKCFNSNSSLKNMMDNKIVTIGAADTMTDKAPVEFEDFSRVPNMTAPQICNIVVITA